MKVCGEHIDVIDGYVWVAAICNPVGEIAWNLIRRWKRRRVAMVKIDGNWHVPYEYACWWLESQHPGALERTQPKPPTRLKHLRYRAWRWDEGYGFHSDPEAFVVFLGHRVRAFVCNSDLAEQRDIADAWREVLREAGLENAGNKWYLPVREVAEVLGLQSRSLGRWVRESDLAYVVSAPVHVELDRWGEGEIEYEEALPLRHLDSVVRTLSEFDPDVRTMLLTFHVVYGLHGSVDRLQEKVRETRKHVFLSADELRQRSGRGL